MNGKTFLSTYINEDPKKVLDTQYVLVSSMIRKSGRYENQVVNAATALYPSERLIIDYSDYTDPDYCNQYMEQLKRDAKPFLASLISYVLDNDATVVFLCSEKEWKRRYLKLIRKFVKEEFGFHIYDYKKVKSGKEKTVEIDESAVYDRCQHILKKAQKEQKERMLSSNKGREKYFKELSKSDLKKELKKRGVYIEGMDKSEMIETLDAFM